MTIRDPRPLGRGGCQIDTCILIDIISPESQWHRWSVDAIALMKGERLISPIVFSEICVPMPTIYDALRLIESLSVTIHHPNPEALFLASKKQLVYRRHRRQGGRKTALPDFFIGAQACVEKVCLVTRDKSRFQTYFPSLQIMAPADN